MYKLIRQSTINCESAYKLDDTPSLHSTLTDLASANGFRKVLRNDMILSSACFGLITKKSNIVPTCRTVALSALRFDPWGFVKMVSMLLSIPLSNASSQYLEDCVPCLLTLPLHVLYSNAV